ncbi:MAG: DNA-directed RNA polymerase, alpha subunit, DNA-directed RNA polymerase subunit alpha [Parcubacteria group bacterium GW2011_GWC1_41_7]|nr:MAG: DNA-directed RNA polymerase, alpha subunit, DNA-directed RNA polymerase subunit alpha [Parcubacteria group bacterium GW2011_GWC1_41_7]
MAENILLPNPPKLVSSEGALAVFEISPLYPGYGITIGNALRRVMLSSIKGSAITRVHFDSVTHEFESIPDVLEDVLDITLNLKQVRVDFPGEEPITLTLDASGKGEVRAKDLKGPGGLIIANPEQLIATLTAPKASLKLSMVVEKGVGFISAETAERDRIEPGTIVLDAIFSPVKNLISFVFQLKLTEPSSQIMLLRNQLRYY